MTRQGLKISFTVAGEPELMAEGLANLVGFDEDHLNGKYSNDRVTHIFTPGGTYKTRVEASVLL